MKIPKICIVIALIGFALTFVFAKNNYECSPGCITYKFLDGKIQCLSEIDENDHIYISLAPIQGNTNIYFYGIESHPSGPVVVIVMSVKDDTSLCASWVNLQEVKIPIDPLKVTTTSLTGNVVYNKENITVFATERKNFYGDLSEKFKNSNM